MQSVSLLLMLLALEQEVLLPQLWGPPAYPFLLLPLFLMAPYLCECYSLQHQALRYHWRMLGEGRGQKPASISAIVLTFHKI